MLFMRKKAGLKEWRRGQDSNLQALAGGGFQDRCITNYATPPWPLKIYPTASANEKAEGRKQKAVGRKQKAKGRRR